MLTILHRTEYRYAKPVLLHPHRMLIHPRGEHYLRLVDASLTCTPNARIIWSQDIFSNLVATATFAEPCDHLVIENRLTIDHFADHWPVFAIAPHAHNYPFDYSDEERRDLGTLLSSEDRDPTGQIQQWVAGFVYSNPTDTLALLQDVNAGMLAGFTYRQREEEGTQAPYETLQLASGSCRDLAALFIEAVRILGFGARAVSGYFFEPDLEAGQDQHQSTHAWAEVYVPGAGWIAFDPTNSRMGNASLVPVAVARSISQIVPITGSYIGAAEDFIDMTVDVQVTPGR